MKIDYYKYTDSNGIISYTAEVRNHWRYWFLRIVIFIWVCCFIVLFTDKLGFLKSKPAPTIHYKAPNLKDKKPKTIEPVSRDYDNTQSHLI